MKDKHSPELHCRYLPLGLARIKFYISDKFCSRCMGDAGFILATNPGVGSGVCLSPSSEVSTICK